VNQHSNKETQRGEQHQEDLAEESRDLTLRVIQPLRGYSTPTQGLSGYSTLAQGLSGYSTLAQGLSGYSTLAQGLSGYSTLAQGLSGYSTLAQGLSGYSTLAQAQYVCMCVGILRVVSHPAKFHLYCAPQMWNAYTQ
jgi:hypothetical protein